MQAQFHREQYILITTFRYSMCFRNNAQYSDYVNILTQFHLWNALLLLQMQTCII